MRLAAAPVAPASHTGHLLLATGFVVLALAAVSLAEQHKARRARRSPRPRTPTPVLVVAGSGAAAGAIHLAVTPGHWTQAPIYGAFFLVAGVTQLVWASLLIHRCSPALLGLNLLANVGLSLLWLQTRTSGVPLGPAAGLRENVGPLDLACTAIELLAVIAAARVLWHRRTARRRQASASARTMIPGQQTSADLIGVRVRPVLTHEARPLLDELAAGP